MSQTRRSSRVSTSRYTVPSFNRLPQVMEEFEVLWDIGGKLEWWSGELIDNPKPSTAKNSHFVATLRYKPRRKYKAVDYEVSFPPTSSSGSVKRLQHTSPYSDELTPWKFPEERVEKSDFARDDSPTSRTFSTNVQVDQRSTTIPENDVLREQGSTRHNSVNQTA